jgi:hypothetical protein
MSGITSWGPPTPPAPAEAVGPWSGADADPPGLLVQARDVPDGAMLLPLGS